LCEAKIGRIFDITGIFKGDNEITLDNAFLKLGRLKKFILKYQILPKM
jgi:hypothetical protein